MSWFGKDLSAVLETESNCKITETTLNEEIADGVVLERRSVLWLSAAAVGVMLGSGDRLSAQDKPSRPQDKPNKSGLSFADFLSQIYPLSQKLVDSKGKDEEAYLMTVAAAMTRLADPAANLRQEMRKFRDEHRKDGERFPLSAMSMRLQAGRGFSHHDHRNYNGVIMGLDGEVRIRNYDILGPALVPPEGKTFQIRETRDDLILPGRFSSLALRRDNIHELVAGPKGGRVLDVFTFLGKGATSKYLDVEDKPRDAGRRIYDAAWKTRRRR